MKRLTAKEVEAVVDRLAGEMVTRHETVKLGPDLFVTIYDDGSISFVHGGRSVVMMDAEQAKKLVEAIA